MLPTVAAHADTQEKRSNKTNEQIPTNRPDDEPYRHGFPGRVMDGAVSRYCKGLGGLGRENDSINRYVVRPQIAQFAISRRIPPFSRVECFSDGRAGSVSFRSQSSIRAQFVQSGLLNDDRVSPLNCASASLLTEGARLRFINRGSFSAREVASPTRFQQRAIDRRIPQPRPFTPHQRSRFSTHPREPA